MNFMLRFVTVALIIGLVSLIFFPAEAINRRFDAADAMMCAGISALLATAGITTLVMRVFATGSDDDDISHIY